MSRHAESDLREDVDGDWFASKLPKSAAMPLSPRKKRLSTKVNVLDNTMRVTTPENISFEYQLAGPFRRLIAYFIDIAVTILSFMLLSFLMFLLVIFVLNPLAELVGLRSVVDMLVGVAVGFMLVVYFLVYWFYGAFWETYFNGQTIGKRISGLRVLSVNGHTIDGVQATLRNFFRLLDVWPMIPLALLFDLRDVDPDTETFARNITFPTGLIGLVVMSFSPRFQRIGDWVAGTVVISEVRANSPQLITFSDPRVSQLAELIPNSFVPSNKLALAIASYVELRRRIHASRANEIAGHVAVPLLEKFGLRPDTNYDLFLCSLYYKIFRSTTTESSVDSISWVPPVGSSMLPTLPSSGPRGDR